MHLKPATISTLKNDLNKEIYKCSLCFSPTQYVHFVVRRGFRQLNMPNVLQLNVDPQLWHTVTVIYSDQARFLSKPPLYTVGICNGPMKNLPIMNLNQ